MHVSNRAGSFRYESVIRPQENVANIYNDEKARFTSHLPTDKLIHRYEYDPFGTSHTSSGTFPGINSFGYANGAVFRLRAHALGEVQETGRDLLKSRGKFFNWTSTAHAKTAALTYARDTFSDFTHSAESFAKNGQVATIIRDKIGEHGRDLYQTLVHNTNDAVLTYAQKMLQTQPSDPIVNEFLRNGGHMASRYALGHARREDRLSQMLA